MSDRHFLRALFDAGVAAAHPQACLPPHLPSPPAGRIVLLAAGKAAAAMVAVAERVYLDDYGLAASRLVGLAVTRHGYGVPTRHVPVVEAGHPVPDAAGLRATEETLALARSAGSDDLVLVLLSGGASANWIAPAGAPVLTLAISDVPRDDPSAIGSGPTVPDPTTLADAREVVRRYALDLPAAARALLDDPANETPKPDDPAFALCRTDIIARPRDALDAAAALARTHNYEVVDLGPDLEGEAREVAARHAALARELAAAGRRAVIVSGGELTVTVRGRGRGGPNQEYALALARALEGAPAIAAISGDTDGTDGGGGHASDPAGALVDATTLARARALGLDPEAALADNDSTGFFEALGDLLTPGPTFTNVNDLRAIVVGG